ncbi:hypothetical protein HOLleu_38372 [Holothuria leucospilota]|uniref:Uncharacterized protein n=1 Tax=Holothuria leucospilota TaxID=206669 RepID=A0A9Q0YE73_HOLLE|nr:hypothetical protein HOLleu_38372 [Holothuria leucospilota]
MVVIRGNVSKKVFQHFLLLSVAIFCLSAPSYCASHWECANDLLQVFVKRWQQLYGKDMMVYNVHGLCHLASDVTVFGNLDSFSAFAFENFLGRLKKMLRKPNNTLPQVIAGYLR